MIDHSLVTGFTMLIRRSFDMTCFGISTYHRHEPPLRLAVGWFKRRSVVLACSLCWLGRQSPTLPFVCCGCASGGASVLLSCRVTWHTARAWCVWCVWATRTRAAMWSFGGLLATRGPKKHNKHTPHSTRTPPRII